MKVLAPRVARSAQPDNSSSCASTNTASAFRSRSPISTLRRDGVTIITQAIGASTRKICALNGGDALADFLGPLGRPSEFVKMPVEELRPRRATSSWRAA